MVNKVYFGVPGAIREIRAPESGMDFTSNVDTEVTELVSGGRSVYRAPTAFKTFSLAWKSHGEALDQIVDMFNGQLDNGPYYITDPTVIGGNVLPARWSHAYQLAYQANGWCKPTVISSTKPNTPDNTKYYTRKSVKLTQRSSGSSVPTSGILTTRVIRVPGKPYYLAVQGSRTGSSAIYVRGYNESTDTWDLLTTFTTFTGVPTSVVSTANTTYSMIELDVYMPLSSTLTLTGISLGSEDYRLPGNVLKNNFAINPRGGGNSTSYWNVAAGTSGTATLTAYPTTYPYRTNWAKNPQGTSTTNFASYITGTSETGTTTYVTGAVDGPLPEITNYGRWTVTTAKTANSTGWASSGGVQRNPYTGFLGETVTVSMYVRYTGTGTLTGTPRATVYTAAGASINGADASAVTLTSGVWTRISSTVTATADFATVGWWFFHLSGQIPPVGSTTDVTGVLIERGATVGQYFDGTTANTTTDTYTWAGTAHASTPIDTQASTGPDGRTGFVRYTQTLSATGGTVGPFYRDTTERLGGVAGDVRYPTLWVRVNETRQVSIASSFKNTANADVGPVAQGPIVTLQPNVWYRFDQGIMVATAPFVRFQTWVKTIASPGVPVLGNFTFDSILLLSDKPDQDYYDGSSTDPGDRWYYWTGTVGTTESVMTDHAPFNYMPTGQGVGAIMPTGSLTGTLVSQAIDRRGLTLDFTEVQNVERTSF